MNYWTKERRQEAKDALILLDPETGQAYDTLYVGDSGLFKLVPVSRLDAPQAESPTVGRQRMLEGELSLSAPDEAATFVNPRTVRFEASVATLSLSYSFVFEYASESPVSVAIDQIDSVTGIASGKVGGFAAGRWTWRLVGTDATGSVVATSPRRTVTIEGTSGRRLQQTNVSLAPWDFGGQVERTIGLGCEDPSS